MNEDRFLELAADILEGTPVAWDTLPEPVSAFDRGFLNQLRVLAEVTRLHRLAQSPVGGAWGSLRVVEHIGAGTFGDVYRAIDPELDRAVALKLLRSPTAGQSVAEGRLLARVRHPNVVTVFGGADHDGRYGLWMEFVQGRTLANLVAADGPFSARDAAAIGVDVCRALAAVHACGLLHGDIKAQNVMREPDGRIVLMDFGTSRLAHAIASPALAGTPLYLAPEVLDGEPATPASDVYSVGVLLYFLVTGSFPATGSTLDEVGAVHHDGRRIAVRERRADVPRPLAAVIDRATAGVDRRYPSAADLEAALMSAMAARRRMTVVLAIGALAAVAVLGTLSGAAGVFGRPSASSASLTIRRIALSAGIDGVSGLSSDGQFVSYVDWDTGNLALLDLTNGQRRRLTDKTSWFESADFAESSAFAPGDRQIAYVWCGTSGDDGHFFYQIRVISVDGGQPRVVYGSTDVGYISAVEWLPDGKHLVISALTDERTTRIVVVSAADGAARTLKTLDWRYPSKLSASPDGRFVAFDVPPEEGLTQHDVFVLPVDGGPDWAVVQHPANDVVAGWSPDGNALVFESNRTTGSSGLWTVAIAGGQATGPAELLRPDIGRTWPMRVTSAGTYYYAVPIEVEDVYEVTLDAAATAVVGAPSQMAQTYVGSNAWPDWSPDGTQIAFVSKSRLGPPRIRGSLSVTIQTLASGEQRQLAPPLTDVLRLRWSPDGRSILAVGRDRRKQSGLYQIDAQTGDVTVVLRTTMGLPRQIAWSPDQSAIFYSNPATGARIIRRELASGREREILPAGLYDFALSPDGRLLAGNIDDPSGKSSVLTLVAAEGGPRRELARADGSGAFTLGCAWGPDSQTLYCVKRVMPGDVRELWQYQTVDGQARRLLVADNMRQVRVHPDGRRLAFVAGRFNAEVWAMEGLVAAGDQPARTR